MYHEWTKSCVGKHTCSCMIVQSYIVLQTERDNQQT